MSKPQIMKVHKIHILLFIIITLPVLTYCKKNKKTSFIKNVNDEEKVFEKITNEGKNSDIINSLHRLNEVIENSDNEGFSDFFTFPTKKYYYVSLIKAIEYFKDSLITKKYFIENSYVPNVDYDPSLDNLLNKLDFNLLKTKNIVEKSFEVENDECSYHYKIEVRGNSVILTYKSISNPKYEEEDYSCEPENDVIYMKLEENRLLFDQDKIEMSYELPVG